MIIIDDKTKCCGCYACYNICPKSAIKMQEDEKGFKYPIVDKEKCIDCGLCKKVCPILSKRKKEEEYIEKAYACINKNEKIRIDSSSGGIFTIIAQYILKLDGVVFGAQFDDDFNVIHSYVEKEKDLKKFRGAKYVQSQIGDMYKKVQEFLLDGRFVLFTGTPCQIEGLRSYLKKDYSNLYLQDIICHGVPSPKVWKKYINYREKKDKGNIEKIKFRDKITGWKKYSVSFKYKTHSYEKKQNEDTYMQIFLSDIALRDSCYECNFKEIKRNSDITLADFWGIENIMPEMDDDKGTSLVILHSKKGEKLFNNIKDDIRCKEVVLEDAIKFNTSMIKSSNKNEKYDFFWDNIDKYEIEKLAKITGIKPTYLSRIKKKFNFNI